MTAARNLPAAFSLLIFAVAYALLYMMVPPLLSDSDISWHIKAGDVIRSLGRVPATDGWAYTAAGVPWYNISWLWDVWLSVLHQLFGLRGVFFFALLMASACVVLALHLLPKRVVVEGNVHFALAIVLSLVMAEYTNGRPQMFAFMLTLLFHHLLSQRKLKWLPLLVVVWVNVHGSFFVAFTLLGAYGLEAIYRKEWAWFKQLVMASILCVLALGVNPDGVFVMTGVARTLDSVITQFISEWLPFVFGKSLGISIWLMLFLWVSNFRESKISLSDKIALFIWLISMFFSIRNAGFVVLISLPYLAVNMRRMLDALAHIRTSRTDIAESINKPRMVPLMLVGGVVVVVLSMTYGKLLRGADDVVYPPYDITKALAHIQTQHAGKNLLNDYTLGGQIIYEMNGTLPVFVDGRAGTAYSEALLSDYIALHTLKEGWKELAKKYDIQVMLWLNYEPFVKAYEGGLYHDVWQQTYHDDVASVFVRKGR